MFLLFLGCGVYLFMGLRSQICRNGAFRLWKPQMMFSSVTLSLKKDFVIGLLR